MRSQFPLRGGTVEGDALLVRAGEAPDARLDDGEGTLDGGEMAWLVSTAFLEEPHALRQRAFALDTGGGPLSRMGDEELRELVLARLARREPGQVAEARTTSKAPVRRSRGRRSAQLRLLWELNARAEREAGELDLGADGTPLLAALARAFGSGVTRDPCYPCLGRALRGPGCGPVPRHTVRRCPRVGSCARLILVHPAPRTEHDAQG